jgi:hypothetical protein
LRYRDPALHAWRLEPGEHRIIVARSAADPAPLTASLVL